MLILLLKSTTSKIKDRYVSVMYEFEKDRMFAFSAGRYSGGRLRILASRVSL